MTSAAPAGSPPRTDDSPALEARGITRTYGTGPSTVTALDGVDVDIARGAFTAIMGPSGSGKSTLLHVLAGLDAVDSGSILLDGTEITTLRDDALTRLRRERIGFVFQSFNLLPMLTAEQNILLPLELAGTRVDRTWLDTLVTAFGIADRLDHLPSQLSGGQIQRVAISRALITSPAVVFADEPTGNLDSRSTEEVLDFLRLSVDEFGQTVVMVTHEREAAERADRILTLADGRIAADEDLRGQRR
ncbi:ABC transporter ATP-binding protein [Brachybacterium aquaticum]|uniref:Putative ABC transport system ATP-binding protein n=1 Tax=Brachybacterium aquaticum TaxID=1432564 RepID=A0A841ACY0_9MICO|nr:ABC transporter ATP-binding protein [Brachybacterium aquaticum]MBB5830958.1 putative ABC transport system ATP-binding protein [Brachybacterium aquaticum]